MKSADHRSPITDHPRPQRVPLYPGKGGEPGAITVAPGKTIVDLPITEVSRIAVTDWLPQGDGTYKPVARIHQQQVRLTPDLLAKLGLGVRHETLKRLIKAGFVKGRRVAPNCYVFDLQSWFDHVERCTEDPDFWAEGGKNIREYRTAI